MKICKNCSLPIEIKQGRRPREFCDNNQKCRNEYFRKNKKVATHKTITIEQWNEIQKALINDKEVGEVVKSLTTNIKILPPKELKKEIANEPKENTMAFFNKYGCNTFAEVKNKK